MLGLISMFVGVADFSLSDLLSGRGSASLELAVISRFPRSAALLLAGASVSVGGLIMQMLARNRFVEPSTVGTTEFAALGLLLITMVAPGAPVVAKTVVAFIGAMAGSLLFLRVLRLIPLRSALIVPLVGIMVGGVIGAITSFIAYNADLMQSLGTWMTGDFSGVIQGRYELLWTLAILTAVAYLAADRFTVAGLGEAFTTNLGLNHRRVVTLGILVVAAITAVTVSTVGALPFLGLIVPNVASRLVGDNLRQSIPWVAVLGAGLVVLCDLLGRLARFPYEIPIGTVLGVVGSAVFLFLLLRRQR